MGDKYERSADQRGISLKVDGHEVPFELIKDTEKGQVFALVIGSIKNTDYALKQLNRGDEGYIY